jgi:predicted lipid-binding transport protein (Tim44 family)
MGSQMPFVDILIFAIIAIFLITRLRSILGSRDGFEQPQRSRIKRDQDEAQEGAAQDNVVPLRDPTNAEAELPSGSGLAAVRKYDAGFSEDSFGEGAKAAFQMILQAFAEGDLAQLRRLLSFDLMEEFSESIRARNKNDEQLVISVDDLQAVTLLDGEVVNGIASVTVRFVSVQTRRLTDSAGKLIDEESIEQEKMTDIWVFERDTQLSDPNWKLVETRAGDDD